MANAGLSVSSNRPEIAGSPASALCCCHTAKQFRQSKLKPLLFVLGLELGVNYVIGAFCFGLLLRWRRLLFSRLG